MRQKIILLAVGALVAVPFAALPAIALAGEFETHCEGAAICTGTIAAAAQTIIELEDDSGQKIRCTTLAGNTEFTSTTKTGTATLDFGNCREQETIFKFSCNTPGKPNGTIIIQSWVYHIVNLNDPEAPKSEPNTPGIALTGTSATITCAGFEDKTITGSVLGDVEAPACNTASTTTTVNFQAAASPTGTQKFEQITKTGTLLDLTWGPHTNDLTTLSLIVKGIITWNKPVKITC